MNEAIQGFSLAAYERYHFIGIGGIGMSGLAEILARSGYRVSGSDLVSNPVTANLVRLGIRCELGHRPTNLGDCQVVVCSSAIPAENPELKAALRRGLRVIHRSQVLAALMAERRGISVCGTHGKTTTTSMLALALIEGGLDPTVVNGARLEQLGGNARYGNGPYLLAEADESDRSFLRLRPRYAVVTNIDTDHMDEYRDLRDVQAAFLEHMNRVPGDGCIVACADDPPLAEVLKKVHPRVLTYGLSTQSDVSARAVRSEGLRVGYECCADQMSLGRVELQVPGLHNVLNSLAVVALSLRLGIEFASVQDALHDYRGAERRLQFKGERRGVRVMDDYGHHPTEIRATLAACRASGRRIVAVYQPHRYSRTLHLMEETARCFEDADRLFLLDVYAAGEEPVEGGDSRRLAEAIGEHRQVTYLADRDAIVPLLENESAPGDLLLTIGAGDVWKIGEEFLG